LSKAGKQECEINCKQFYQGLVDSMAARLLSDAYKRINNLVNLKAIRIRCPAPQTTESLN